MPGADKDHALLSASGSHKWLVCSPSARLEEGFENKTSSYMAEGTLAHAIAELKVKNYFLDPMGKRKFNSEMKKLQKSEFYNEEMQGYTDTYLDYLKELALKSNIKPSVAVEVKIDYSKYAKEGFGTADCIMVMGDRKSVV